MELGSIQFVINGETYDVEKKSGVYSLSLKKSGKIKTIDVYCQGEHIDTIKEDLTLGESDTLHIEYKLDVGK